MNRFTHDMSEQTVSPILIKNRGSSYLTLYYFTERSDSLLHRDSRQILYFRTMADLEAFCQKNGLQTENELLEYDFDLPLENPIHFSRVLNNWNLLNTASGILGMFFEGDCRKYNPLYDLLFRLSTPIEPIPPTYRVSERDYNYILKVFRKKDRCFKRFALYHEE